MVGACTLTFGSNGGVMNKYLYLTTWSILEAAYLFLFSQNKTNEQKTENCIIFSFFFFFCIHNTKQVIIYAIFLKVFPHSVTLIPA